MALRDLEEAIRNLEAARAAGRQELADSHGSQAEALAIALDCLEKKLVESKAARQELVVRGRRVKRTQEIAAELRGVRRELEALVVTGAHPSGLVRCVNMQKP